jgi:hypothetical protein
MGRIISIHNRYYEESSGHVSVENGRALFLAQLEHDLSAARKDSEKRRKELPQRVVKRSIWGLALSAIGAFSLWVLVSAIHWFWAHPLW